MLKLKELKAIASRMALTGRSKYTRKQPSSISLSKIKHHSLRYMNSCWRFGLSTADKGFVAEERLSKERLTKALPKATGVCLSR